MKPAPVTDIIRFMIRRIIRFFDKLEDKVRGGFSRYPIFYAIVGGAGTVFCWRGLWHIADFVSANYFTIFYSFNNPASPSPAVDMPYLWDGLISLALGTGLLLITGLFVATFIGDHIIVSGLKHEKKVAEKTEKEVEEEEDIIKRVHEELHIFSKRLEAIEKKLDDKR